MKYLAAATLADVEECDCPAARLDKYRRERITKARVVVLKGLMPQVA